MSVHYTGAQGLFGSDGIRARLSTGSQINPGHPSRAPSRTVPQVNVGGSDVEWRTLAVRPPSALL